MYVEHALMHCNGTRRWPGIRCMHLQFPASTQAMRPVLRPLQGILCSGAEDRHCNKVSSSLETVAFKGARGPEPGSGLVRFHWEGIPVMLAPVSSLMPPVVVAVCSAPSCALAPGRYRPMLEWHPKTVQSSDARCPENL